MKVRITRTDLGSEPREYNLNETLPAIAAMNALERYRKDTLHAISLKTEDDGTLTIKTAPATYTVEVIS